MNINELTQKAKQGDIPSIHQLVLTYSVPGMGESLDQNKFLYWLKIYAAYKQPMAMLFLARIYCGYPKDEQDMKTSMLGREIEHLYLFKGLEDEHNPKEGFRLLDECVEIEEKDGSNVQQLYQFYAEALKIYQAELRKLLKPETRNSSYFRDSIDVAQNRRFTLSEKKLELLKNNKNQFEDIYDDMVELLEKALYG